MNNELKINFVGDIFPSDKAYTLGFGIRSTFPTRAKIWIDDFQQVLGECDFAIGNLESPLVSSTKALHDSFYGLPEFAELLNKTKFSIVNIANNHILEQGDGGLAETITTLHDSGIKIIGCQEGGKSKILYKNANGVKIAFAGFCDERICTIPNTGAYSALTEQSVMETLNRMKESDADIRIIVFHWGNEYIHYPSFEQRFLAHKLIDNGAHLIVGHHSHCIQPYEHYANGHILYSLGNFCFDDLQSKLVSVGMMAQIIIQDKRIASVQLHGLQLEDPTYSEHLVHRMSQKKFAKLYAKIEEKFRQMLEFNNKAYEQTYRSEVAVCRRKQRIAKKIILLQKILFARLSIKRRLIKNIIAYNR